MDCNYQSVEVTSHPVQDEEMSSKQVENTGVIAESLI